jgi:hypothetical protein
MRTMINRRRAAQSGSPVINYLILEEDNKPVYDICVQQGWCSSEGMTYDEAALITSLGSDGHAFQGKTAITHFEELAYFGITEIQGYAFDGCTNLTSIGIPDAVTKFSSYCFRNCALTSIYIPVNVTSFGSGVFQGVSTLTNVIIPANVTSIGSNAFAACSGLTYIKCLAITPPTLGNTTALGASTYTFPIYVPDASVNAYKTAWSDVASRIYPISEFVQP